MSWTLRESKHGAENNNDRGVSERQKQLYTYVGYQVALCVDMTCGGHITHSACSARFWEAGFI